MSAPRCKPGDLAIVLKGRNNVGACVRVERRASQEEILSALRIHSGHKFDVAHGKEAIIWRIDLPMLWVGGDGEHPCSIPYHIDESLMPITPPEEMVNDIKEQEMIV